MFCDKSKTKKESLLCGDTIKLKVETAGKRKELICFILK
jgi:hypothetical protein